MVKEILHEVDYRIPKQEQRLLKDADEVFGAFMRRLQSSDPAQRVQSEPSQIFPMVDIKPAVIATHPSSAVNRASEVHSRRNGNSHQPRTLEKSIGFKPEVRRGNLHHGPTRAFFRGLALGRNRIKEVRNGRDNFIAVFTESRSEYRRDLLEKTLGTWGETHRPPTKATVYLDNRVFGYMQTPTLPRQDYERVFEDRELFPSFLLAIMLSELTPKEQRLPLQDEELLRRLADAYRLHFKAQLGTIAQEPDRRGGWQYLQVDNSVNVYRNLLTSKSVQALPFYQDLRRTFFPLF